MNVELVIIDQPILIRVRRAYCDFKLNHYDNPKTLTMHPMTWAELMEAATPGMIGISFFGESEVTFMGMKLIRDPRVFKGEVRIA